MAFRTQKIIVIPMKIGTQLSMRPTEDCESHHAENWVPAFAGMTNIGAGTEDLKIEGLFDIFSTYLSI